MIPSTLRKRSENFHGLIFMVVFLGVLMAVTGCSRVNQRNYAKIKVGMEYEEIVAILGEPTNCNSVLNAANCTWGDTKRSIDISFVADKVVFLSGSGL